MALLPALVKGQLVGAAGGALGDCSDPHAGADSDAAAVPDSAACTGCAARFAPQVSTTPVAQGAAGVLGANAFGLNRCPISEAPRTSGCPGC